jgi:hypothetical protein
MAVREAELRLKPTMGDRGRQGLRRLRDEGRKASRDLEQGFRRATREGLKLERTFDAVGRSANHASNAARTLVGHALSLKGLAVGLAAGGAGKTIFDSMIGSNATLESQRITFNTMMGDVGKATKLMNQLRGYAASTPFAQGDLIDGSKRLLRLTGENVDQNVKLVKLASQMAAINPDKTISDAAEAILDAEGLEFERLKEFGLKLKRDDLKKMKKRGETLGQTALRGVEEALAKQTGGRDVVAALSQSFNGKLSTLKDNFTETMRLAGEPAFEVLKDGLDDIGKDFAKLQSDPQFKQDLKELATFTMDMAKASVRLARALPGAIRDAKAMAGDIKSFVSENKTLLGLAGAAFGAHKLTGGATTRGAMSLGSRLLFGKKGGGGAGALAEFGGAQPVFVVNMPGGGLANGAGSFLQRNAGKASGAAGAASGAARMGAGGVLRSIASRGLVGALGAGPAGVIAGGIGFLGGQLYVLGKVTEGTSNALKGFEEKADAAAKRREARENRREPGVGRNHFKTLFNERMDPSGKLSRITQANADRLDQMYGSTSLRSFKANAFAALGGADAEYTGSDFQKAQLAAINQRLAKRGLKMNLTKGADVGQALFSGGESVMGDELAGIRKMRKSLDEDPARKLAMERSGDLAKFLAMEKAALNKAKRADAMAQGLNMAAVDASLTVASGAITVYVNGEGQVNEARLALETRKQLEELQKQQADLAAMTSAGGG